MAAARHMHQYGTTREHLAEVAVAARQWALMNPKAWEKEPLTIEQVVSMLGISRSRVRRLEAEGLAQLARTQEIEALRDAA